MAYGAAKLPGSHVSIDTNTNAQYCGIYYNCTTQHAYYVPFSKECSWDVARYVPCLVGHG